MKHTLICSKSPLEFMTKVNSSGAASSNLLLVELSTKIFNKCLELLGGAILCLTMDSQRIRLIFDGCDAAAAADTADAGR